jgi:hypothetical protein
MDVTCRIPLQHALFGNQAVRTFGNEDFVAELYGFQRFTAFGRGVPVDRFYLVRVEKSNLQPTD